MNKKEVLQSLAALISDYRFHPRCAEEMRRLLSHELNGKADRFFHVLYAQLYHIRTFGPLIYRVDSHELLKGCAGPFYSIHLQQSQFNIRLLAYITYDHPPLFLCIFYERGGKSVSDYSARIPLLQSRLQEMREVDQNEDESEKL